MFNNQTIVITGGASGIGLEVANAVVQNNGTALIIDNNKETLGKLKKEDNFYTFQADVATMALGRVELNFTASAFNIGCINSASTQPSFSSPFTPTIIDSPGQGCCDDISDNISATLW